MILPAVTRLSRPEQTVSSKSQWIDTNQGFQSHIPARSCIPTEHATGELYAEDAALHR
jgi:hypothetical protein